MKRCHPTAFPLATFVTNFSSESMAVVSAASQHSLYAHLPQQQQPQRQQEKNKQQLTNATNIINIINIMRRISITLLGIMARASLVADEQLELACQR